VPNQISQNALITLREDEIPPGETIDVAITLTAAKSGIFDLDSLLIYSDIRHHDIIHSKTLSQRLDVQTSIRLSAQVKETRYGAYLLALDIRNTSSSAIHIDSVQGYSPFWQLTCPAS
jgi:hypothetical protein